MPTTISAARSVRLAWHLLVATVADITGGIGVEWRRHRSWPATLRAARTVVRYYLLEAVDPRSFVAGDGDLHGRRRGDLDRPARRLRRRAADLRRRRVSVLLRALGDTPAAVAAGLARHHQLTGVDAEIALESYLARRLDVHARQRIDVGPRLSCIGGTWLITPPAVGAYLRHRQHHGTTPATGQARTRGLAPA